MSYRVVKVWDNRAEVKKLKLPTTNSRTWTRRVQWLGSSEFPDSVKLKFDDGDVYSEVGVATAFAQTVWNRLKEGMSVQDAVSLFTCKVKLSRKAKES